MTTPKRSGSGSRRSTRRSNRWRQTLGNPPSPAMLSEVRISDPRGDVATARRHLDTAIAIATEGGPRTAPRLLPASPLAQLLNAARRAGRGDPADRERARRRRWLGRVRRRSTPGSNWPGSCSSEVTTPRLSRQHLRSLELAESHPAPQFELEAHLGLRRAVLRRRRRCRRRPSTSPSPRGSPRAPRAAGTPGCCPPMRRSRCSVETGPRRSGSPSRSSRWSSQAADPSAEFVALELLGRRPTRRRQT